MFEECGAETHDSTVVRSLGSDRLSRDFSVVMLQHFNAGDNRHCTTLMCNVTPCVNESYLNCRNSFHAAPWFVPRETLWRRRVTTQFSQSNSNKNKSIDLASSLSEKQPFSVAMKLQKPGQQTRINSKSTLFLVDEFKFYFARKIFSSSFSNIFSLSHFQQSVCICFVFVTCHVRRYSKNLSS